MTAQVTQVDVFVELKHTHTRLRSLDQARWGVQYKPQAVIHTHDVTQGRLGLPIHKRAHEMDELAMCHWLTRDIQLFNLFVPQCISCLGPNV